MSVQDLPSDPETINEPDDVVVRRLVRAIDYAEGFWLGLAKSNTPAQRRRLAALCRSLLEPLKVRVLEIELNEPVTDLLPVLRERLAQEHATPGEDAPSGEAYATASSAHATTGEASTATEHKLAIFVYGLEHSIPSREAYPPLLSSLNLNRELFRQQLPHPLLLWLPDYALTALARKAPRLLGLAQRPLRVRAGTRGGRTVIKSCSQRRNTHNCEPFRTGQARATGYAQRTTRRLS